MTTLQCSTCQTWIPSPTNPLYVGICEVRGETMPSVNYCLGYKFNSPATVLQQEPQPGQKVVVDEVLKDINERIVLGVTKLMTFNGRDPPLDLFQELIDAIMYIKQRLMEEQLSDGGNL